MTSGHFIFIPAVLVIGMFIGFLLGTRAAQDRLNMELKRQTEREEAKRQRAERKAAKGIASDTVGGGDKPAGEPQATKAKNRPHA